MSIISGPLSLFAFATLQAIILGIWYHKLTLFMPIYPFWSVGDESWYNVLISIISTVITGTHLLSVLFLIIGIGTITMEYFISIIDAMKILAASIDDIMNEAKFKEIIKLIVDLHCEVIRQQTALRSLIAWPIWTTEITAYGTLMLAWTIFHYDFQNYLVACLFLVISLPYFWLNWMNEKVVGAMDDFKDELYNVKWYELKPQQRKTLLQIYG